MAAPSALSKLAQGAVVRRLKQRSPFSPVLQPPRSSIDWSMDADSPAPPSPAPSCGNTLSRIHARPRARWLAAFAAFRGLRVRVRAPVRTWDPQLPQLPRAAMPGAWPFGDAGGITAAAARARKSRPFTSAALAANGPRFRSYGNACGSPEPVEGRLNR